MTKTQARGPTQTAKNEIEGRAWTARGSTARVLKLALLVCPLVLSLLFSFWVSRTFPPEELGLNRWIWWFGLLVCSVALTRWLEILLVRFTPLATLFQLSLVFPDQAPSRFSMALRAGSVRGVQRKLDDIASTGRAFTEDESYSAQMLDLIRMLSSHDRMTRGHAERVRAYSELIGEEMGLDEDELSKLRWGALLHDMGKLDVPSEILNKPGRPDEDEWAILQNHPAAARAYLAPLADWLGEWAHAADGHHERWDGGGYPDGLAGEHIPRAARIVSVADAFDVMTSTRSYKKAMPLELGRQEVADKAGSQFDPVVARAFLKVSLGDIRRAAGPWSWLTGLPGIQQIPLAAASQQVVTSVTAATAVVVGSAAAVALPPEPVPAAVAFAETIVADDIFLDEDGRSEATVLVAGDGPFTITVRGGEDLAEISVGEPISVEDGVRVPLDVTGLTNAWGTTSVEIIACDVDRCLEPKTVELNVAPINDEPSVRVEPASVIRGESVRFRLLSSSDTAGLAALGRNEHPIFVDDVDKQTVTVSSVISVIRGEVTNDGRSILFTHDGTTLLEAGIRVEFTDGITTTQRQIPIRVTNPNSPPTIALGDASLNETAPPGSVVTTALATDVDGDPVTYTLTSSAAPFTIDESSGVITTTGPVDFDTASNYTITVRATDAWGDSTTSTMRVEILEDNLPPVIEPFADPAVDEDAAPGTVVGTVQASDPNNDPLSFSLVDPAGLGGINRRARVAPSSLFAIHPRTGVLTVSGVLDHETVDEVALAISVTDDEGAVTSVPLKIAILDVNEPPRVLAPTLSILVPEDQDTGKIITTVVATDPEGGDLSYFLPESTLPFTIDENTGQVTLVEGLDHETQPEFTFDVLVADNGSPLLSVAHAVTVTVTDANEEPIIETSAVAIDESAAVGDSVGSVAASDPEGSTLTYTIVGATPDDVLTIDGETGVLSLAQPLDHEASASFTIEVEVVDDTYNTTKTITINVSDVNEQPVVAADQVLYVDEGANSGNSVGTVTATDPELNELSFAITGGNTGDVFAIDSISGEVLVADDDDLDFEGTPLYDLEVTVTEVTADSLTSLPTVVTIRVTDGTEPPIFDNQTLSVDENSPDGAIVGTILATDPDAATTLQYSLVSGDPTGDFVIDTANGDIVVSPTAALDHEATAERLLRIEVTDGLFLVEADVTITIVDVNEAPLAVVPTTAFVFDEMDTSAELTLTALDPESDSLSWQVVGGDDGNKFSLSSSGDLRPNVAIDHESYPTFTLTIRVFEVGNQSNFDEFTLAVTVTDVDEAPRFTSGSAFTVDEDAAPNEPVGTVSTLDPEGETVAYTIEAGPIAIDSSTGALTVAAPLDHEAAPSYLLQVTATDQSDPVARAATQSVLVTVVNINEAPAIIAPANTSLTESDPAGTVLGTATITDPENHPLLLTITGGPFAIAPDGTITTTTAVDHETAAQYDLTITATETIPDNPLIATQDVTVTVDDINERPVIPSSQSFNVDENVDHLLTQVGTITINDEDASPAWVVAITGGNTGGLFTVDNNGQLTLTASPDHETQSTYLLDIEVTDGPHNVPTQITIDINNMNEAPQVSSSGTFTFPEDIAVPTVVAQVTGVDPEGVTPTYSFDVVPPGFPFSIDAGTGEVSANGPFDFEVSTAHAATVLVSDGVNVTSRALNFAIIDVNEAPSVPNQTIPIDETAAVGPVVGSLSISDEDTAPSYTITIENGDPLGLFTMDDNGNLRLTGALDHETTDSHTLDIRIVDGPHTIDTTLVVPVNDINEQPAITTPTSYSINENVANPTVVGDVDADDPEGDSLSYVFTGTPGPFAIDINTGVITTTGTLDHEDVDSYDVTVVVSDGALDDTLSLTIDVNDENERPWISSGQTFSVVENDADGTVLGTVAAGDPDDGDSVVAFTVQGGSGAGLFDIDDSGQITKNGTLEFENAPVFTLNIRAFDSLGLFHTRVVTIDVTSRFGLRSSHFGDLVFNEVIYRDTGVLWQGFELRNESGGTIVLDGWKVTDHEPTVAEAIAVEILLTGSVDDDSISTVLIEPFDGPLGNIEPLTSSDDLWLWDDEGRLVAYISWGDSGSPTTEITSQPPIASWNLWDLDYQLELGSASNGQSISRVVNTDGTNSGCWELNATGAAQDPGRCPGASVTTVDTSPFRNVSIYDPNG